MLSVLHIENIAVIEQADIVFNQGFNVLTGETGAGKTTVLNLLGGMDSCDEGSILVDGVDVEPGDEAVMLDGAVLCVGELKMVLRLYKHSGVKAVEIVEEPYVTRARRGRAQQGHGDGIGAPGRGQIRREKKQWKKRLNQAEVREA